MNYQNDDLRIKEIKELLPPVALLEKFPATENAANTVAHARKAIHKILKGNDDRLLVVIGPCSIHDPVAAKEYATRLLALREELKDELEIVMRVYFEKQEIFAPSFPMWLVVCLVGIRCIMKEFYMQAVQVEILEALLIKYKIVFMRKENLDFQKTNFILTEIT